jgi:hypothetical protein
MGLFEFRPAWVPILDRSSVFAVMFYAISCFCRFERSPSLAAKVRNVSRLGSQIPKSRPEPLFSFVRAPRFQSGQTQAQHLQAN